MVTSSDDLETSHQCPRDFVTIEIGETAVLSREAVEWGYRLILGRDPENESVVAAKMECAGPSDLSGQLLYCDEFISKQPSFMPPLNRWVMIEHPCGFRIWVNLSDTAISWPIMRHDFELPEITFLTNHIGAGDTVIDIGANIGFYSLISANIVGPSGRVIGFEPMPFLHHHAAKSAQENAFQHCILHNVALGIETGSAQLVYAPGSPNWGGAFLSFDGSVLPDHACETVRVHRLSEYLEGVRPNLVKIDIEGGEYLVMSEAKDIIAATKPIILSEIHSAQLRRVSGVSSAEYIELIKGIGYRCFEISSSGKPDIELYGDELFQVVNVVFLPD